MSLFNHPNLAYVVRFPLDANSVRTLARIITDYPDHRLEVEGSFLFVLEVTA